MKKTTACLALLLAALVAGPAVAQESHGGGGAGCGDVFGDLIHILRADTGQPILAMRYIEMPKQLPGYGWGYCPIPVDASGNELGFAPLTCDVATEDLDKVVEVDYFGRLSGGRTKERNGRMHFNEVISNIKMSGGVRLDETGRLQLGYDCTSITSCAEWSVIDSPMENMALYTRLMKYGHFQTDPDEVDMWSHGDPAAGTQYHPALDEADWAKFQPVARHLLPGGGTNFCNTASCVEPESLDPSDFVAAAATLGGAANKDGKVTVDLVQYMNRILKITQVTEATLSTADTLPALVRDCWSSEEDPVLATGPDGEVVAEDPDYDTVCSTYGASGTLPNYEDFADARERFVDYTGFTGYDRTATWGTRTSALIRPLVPALPVAFYVDRRVPLVGWLNFVNPNLGTGQGMDGFVKAASDSLRAVQFVHNYAIPDNLGWNFRLR